ncbi:MAG: hypothetical protein HQK93_10725, partial [Nitrospirae bacterium]|nr:hypothetical protein [Nitrospirota bacterium]
MIEGLPSGVLFDETCHGYTYNGLTAPSVTGLIHEWIGTGRRYINVFNKQSVYTDTFEEAGRFGTDVHMYCKLFFTSGVNWDWLLDHCPDIYPLIKQLEEWADKMLKKTLLVEMPMYSRLYGYFGTPDLLGIDNFGDLILVDFKTGHFDMVGPQTSAYKKLIIENLPDYDPGITGWEIKRC